MGFRAWTRSRARALGLTGWAKNLADGRVEVVAQGPRDACAALLADLRSAAAPGSVRQVVARWDDSPADPLDGFWIG